MGTLKELAELLTAAGSDQLILMDESNAYPRDAQGVLDEGGWRALTQHASQALTRFLPGDRDRDDDETRALWAASPGWGLLAAEIREDDDEICARIEIQFVDGVLVVSGEKQVAREERRGRYHVTERAYGRFERALPLPVEVDESHARADYTHGVLCVRLPKRRRAAGRRIPVRGA
jgi:HSP20 family protein